MNTDSYFQGMTKISRLFLALSEMLKTFFFSHKGEQKWLQEQLPDPSESNEQKIQLTRTKADFGAADKSNSNALSMHQGLTSSKRKTTEDKSPLVRLLS